MAPTTLTALQGPCRDDGPLRPGSPEHADALLGTTGSARAVERLREILTKSPPFTPAQRAAIIAVLDAGAPAYTPEQSAANYVAKALAEAPPLTVFQRERIALICASAPNATTRSRTCSRTGGDLMSPPRKSTCPGPLDGTSNR